jgi:hypothetical protein
LRDREERLRHRDSIAIWRSSGDLARQQEEAVFRPERVRQTPPLLEVGCQPQLAEPIALRLTRGGTCGTIACRVGESRSCQELVHSATPLFVTTPIVRAGTLADSVPHAPLCAIGRNGTTARRRICPCSNGRLAKSAPGSRTIARWLVRRADTRHYGRCGTANWVMPQDGGRLGVLHTATSWEPDPSPHRPSEPVYITVAVTISLDGKPGKYLGKQAQQCPICRQNQSLQNARPGNGEERQTSDSRIGLHPGLGPGDVRDLATAILAANQDDLDRLPCPQG